MEALPGLWSLSPLAALVGVFVLGIYWLAKGTFIPKVTHEAHIAILQGVIDSQARTIDNNHETIAEQRGQITSLLEVGKTVQAVLKAAGPPVDETTGS